MIIDVRVSPSALILGVTFFTGAVLATVLDKLPLRQIYFVPRHVSFCCVLASWAILTTIYNPGNIDHDLHHPRRKIQVRHGTDRRGLA